MNVRFSGVNDGARCEGVLFAVRGFFTGWEGYFTRAYDRL
jgi:hypothetical protein